MSKRRFVSFVFMLGLPISAWVGFGTLPQLGSIHGAADAFPGIMAMLIVAVLWFIEGLLAIFAKFQDRWLNERIWAMLIIGILSWLAIWLGKIRLELNVDAGFVIIANTLPFLYAWLLYQVKRGEI